MLELKDSCSKCLRVQDAHFVCPALSYRFPGTLALSPSFAEGPLARTGQPGEVLTDGDTTLSHWLGRTLPGITVLWHDSSLIIN